MPNATNKPERIREGLYTYRGFKIRNIAHRHGHIRHLWTVGTGRTIQGTHATLADAAWEIDRHLDGK